MSETQASKPVFALRFHDGPLAVVPNVFVPRDLFGWPLPDRLGILAHPGQVNRMAIWDADDVEAAGLPPIITDSPNAVVYRKIAESKLDEDLPNVMRGAQYELFKPPATDSEGD